MNQGSDTESEGIDEYNWIQIRRSRLVGKRVGVRLGGFRTDDRWMEYV